MPARRALVAIVALLPLLLAGPAAAEKRIALVVGNSAYQNIARLDNPRNDATLMAETLSPAWRGSVINCASCPVV